MVETVLLWIELILVFVSQGAKESSDGKGCSRREGSVHRPCSHTFHSPVQLQSFSTHWEEDEPLC